MGSSHSAGQGEQTASWQSTQCCQGQGRYQRDVSHPEWLYSGPTPPTLMQTMICMLYIYCIHIVRIVYTYMYLDAVCYTMYIVYIIICCSHCNVYIL